jgi:hypothetical protein
MIATGSNPSLTLGKAPSNPPPIANYSDKWVKRTYSAFKNAGSAIGEASFLANGFNVPGGKYYVDKIQVWRLGFDTSAEPGIQATFKQGNFTDLGVDDVVGTDYGSGVSLPGVTCKVPLGHATGVSTTSTSPLVESRPVVTATTSQNASYVCHLTCWVSI